MSRRELPRELCTTMGQHLLARVEEAINKRDRRIHELEKQLREHRTCPMCGGEGICEDDCVKTLHRKLERLRENIRSPHLAGCPECGTRVLMDHEYAAGYECGGCGEYISFAEHTRRERELARVLGVEAE